MFFKDGEYSFSTGDGVMAKEIYNISDLKIAELSKRVAKLEEPEENVGKKKKVEEFDKKIEVI